MKIGPLFSFFSRTGPGRAAWTPQSTPAWDHEGQGGSSVPEGQGGSSLPEGHDERNRTYENRGIGSHLQPHELYLQVWLGLVQ